MSRKLTTRLHVHFPIFTCICAYVVERRRCWAIDSFCVEGATVATCSSYPKDPSCFSSPLSQVSFPLLFHFPLGKFPLPNISGTILTHRTVSYVFVGLESLCSESVHQCKAFPWVTGNVRFEIWRNCEDELAFTVIEDSANKRDFVFFWKRFRNWRI